MPKKKDVVKAGTPVRFRENSRIMRAHETMVDLISGRTAGGSFMDALANGILSLDILRGLDEELENEIIYSDDEGNDRFYPAMASNKALAPHPRIRQLTDEEADRHARELIEEEERRKEKMEKNKRKKKRKKEKKRQEKENAVKDILPEEEQGKSDSSENQEESSNIESKAEATESPESSKTQNESEIPECDESSERNKEENLMKMNKKEEEDDDEEQKDLNLNNSYASTADSAPVETRNQTAATERGTENSQLPEIQQPEAEKPKDVEKPEVDKKKEEKQETIKEKTMDPTAEEYAKRSRELAGVGNRLAASGQYGMAVKCFTDAIKYNPTEFKLFGNRSLCYERMQQYENALRDADLALSMEPNWVKGLFRKGKALCGLKRYYEASLVYKEVLNLDSTSLEATQELKRAQTLHLMEMGFSWAQSSQALKTHPTLEEAVEALFGSHQSIPRDVAASRDTVEPPVVQQEGEEEDGQWIVCGLQTTRPRTHQIKESDGVGQSRSNSLSPTPLSKSSVKPELFPIWVGSLAPAVTYATLHELFSRAGTVYSIKMLLEHQCAFVNYTRKEDCDRAIQCINGMVVEGAPLSVRYPNKIPVGLGMSKSAATEPTARPSTSMFKKECFFWRTTGCTRQDCTYKHVPEHKNIDKEKFTSRLASNHV